MCNIFVDDYPSKIIYFFFKLALFFPMTTSFLKGMRTRTDKFKKKKNRLKLKQWKPVSVVLTFDLLRIAYVFVAKKCCVWDCGCRSACVNPVKTHDQV